MVELPYLQGVQPLCYIVKHNIGKGIHLISNILNKRLEEDCESGRIKRTVIAYY